MKIALPLLISCWFLTTSVYGQLFNKKKAIPTPSKIEMASYKSLKWRNIGPFRGGRSVAASGVANDPLTYYFGSTGGGVWKTKDAGISWKNVSDGFFNMGSVGAIAVAQNDPNVLYVGMGEHPIRGVMTSHGDGVYKSTDAGATWTHIGLEKSQHIAAIRIHPDDSDIVWVAVQGAAHGASSDRGIYKTIDGGMTWKKTLYVDEDTGACDLSIDKTNPRILYAGTWEHRRYPWVVKSGGKGSGLYKSTDGGETWTLLEKGLPEMMGKVAIEVSPANPQRVFANIEAEGEKGGVYRSDDGGQSWKQTCKDRVTIARSWYYIEIFADPQDAETVYVLNAPMLRSVDGGKTFTPVANPHSDQHDLWINPNNTNNMILANDGGGCITFNGGKSWSSQQNQPTCQFYRVIADERFPYYLYAGQQDNSTVAIPSRTFDDGIDWKDWYRVAGGESAFLAFDPKDPQLVYGGSYQGNISVYNHATKTTKDIMAYPNVGLSVVPSKAKYRFNWNAPIVAQPQNPSIIYHAGNQVLKTTDGGQSWTEISPDLTRNDTTKHGWGGAPFTNEGAGGENYNTISYLTCSPHQAGVIWTGSDCGLVYRTANEGGDWSNVTPQSVGEALVNSIEVSPHQADKVYLAMTKYKFNDKSPMIYKTTNNGKTWQKITTGIPANVFVRVVREDPKRAGLLYAGTEQGLYISFDDGQSWQAFQNNLPICPINDLTIRDNDLIAATSGRAFWILDDVSALQQADLTKTITDHIIQPKPTYRFNRNTPKKAPTNAGQNTPNGVIIDYMLTATSAADTITLEILDSQGQLVNRYTNQNPSDFKSYPGGPSKPRTLPSESGLNRFNWDLKYESLPAVPKVFIFGGLDGHYAAPGVYTLRLITTNDTVETTCEVLADPRLEATPADYTAQQTALMQITETVKDIHESVNKMRSVKSQVQQWNGLLKTHSEQEALVKRGNTIIERIEKWEQELIQPKQKTFQDVVNFPNQLNSELLNLKARMDTHNPKVTKGAMTRLSDLQMIWQQHKAVFNEIINQDIKAFNEAFQAQQLPALMVD